MDTVESIETKKIKDFFWNGKDIDLEDGMTYREVNSFEFQELMNELYGDGIYDIEAVVMNLRIGLWADAIIEENLDLIELYDSFIEQMSK